MRCNIATGRISIPLTINKSFKTGRWLTATEYFAGGVYQKKSGRQLSKAAVQAAMSIVDTSQQRERKRKLQDSEAQKAESVKAALAAVSGAVKSQKVR